MVKTMPSLQDSEQSVQRTTAHSNTGTVTCAICCALYGPSQAHAYLLQAPPLASESAFMSMCHFCFRCRRPACPLCWDDVHGLCGACVEDVHLPSRKEGEPFLLNSTLLISSSSQTKQHHAAAFPLVCVRPGRFHADASQTESVLESVNVTMSVSEVQQQEVDEVPIQDEAISTSVQERKNLTYIVRRIEHNATVLLGIIVSLIAILIVVALFSEQANTIIAHVLHVDIRMEIEYLLQLIQQPH